MAVPRKPETQPIIFRFVKNIAKKPYKPDYDPDKGVEKVQKYEVNVATKETFESTYYELFDKLANIGGFSVWKTADLAQYSMRSRAWSASRQSQQAQMKQATQLLMSINEISKALIGMYKDLGRINEILGYYKSGKQPSELILKSLWTDLVDAKKGQSSIHAMSSKDLQMMMLRDYFFHLSCKNESEVESKVEELDTTERIKIVLKRKLKEFLDWKKRWKEELKKSKNLIEERIKSQEETINMYKEWARPLIKDVENLMLGLRFKSGEHLDPTLIDIGKSVASKVDMFCWKGYKEPSGKAKEKYESLLPSNGDDLKDWLPAAEYLAKNEFTSYGWYVPVIEVSFDFTGSTSEGIPYPKQVFDTTLTMELKIYDLPAFIKKRKELKEDKADKWFKKVLAPLEKAREELEGKSESQAFMGVKSIFDTISDFKNALTGRGYKDPDMRVMAINELKDSAFSVYEKFKKAQGQLTWGDRAPEIVE